MNFGKSIGIVIAVVGLGIIITAFTGPTLQIAIALVGVGFVCLGLLQMKRIQEKKRDAEKLEEITARLDELKQEMEKLEQPKNTGVAIADVISSGLKYYTEHLTGQKKEEKDD